MDYDRSWGKLAGICGFVFTVLYYVGTVLLVGPITQDDSLGTAKRTFNEQADNFDVGAFLLLLSIPFLLFFAQSLRWNLARAEGPAGTTSSLVLVGAAAGAAITLAGAAVTGGTSFLAEAASVDGRTAAFAHSAAEACIFYGMVFFGVVALTTALITLRHAALPRWFGWVAVALGVAMVVGSAGSPLIRPLALLAGIPTYLFFLIASFVVWRFGGDAPAPANQADAQTASAL
jgi:uncharacterized protein DUF4386